MNLPELFLVYRARNQVEKVARKHRADPLQPESALEQSRRLVTAALQALDKAWALLAFEEEQSGD